uniref:SWIM-type domain-containing protein n=1 Tax=Ananas comosus var. bracteatus TaxID=296719 RepID=A0A6V7PGT3_ANACO|nr:unnamed protein product [Ananas comosus var. bracteatus]
MLKPGSDSQVPGDVRLISLARHPDPGSAETHLTLPAGLSGVSQNRYSWQWFLEQLRDGVVGDRDSSRANTVLTIVSDRQKGLIDAVSDVFPDAAHGYCIYHLSTNLPHAPKNTPAWRRFWAAARAYTVAEFNEHMEKMKELNPEQYKYVVKLPRHRWLPIASWEGGLPITYLVEETRKKTACYFYQRKNNGENITSVVTPYAEKILGSSRETSRFYTLNPSTDVLFQVIAADRTDAVDLSKKTCSCKRWDIDGIPCNHAMAAISFRLRDPYDFVEDWFMTSTYRSTYNDCVPPTRGKEQWPAIPSNVVPPRPPNVRIQPGGRKVSRRESIANGLIKKRCRNCQRWGTTKGHARTLRG